MMTGPSPRRRASLVASPTPVPPSPTTSHIPRPQSAAGGQIPRPSSAAGRYRSLGAASVMSERAPEPVSSNDSETDKGQVRVVLRIRPSEPEDPAVPLRHRSVLVHPTTQTDVRVSVDPATLAGSASLASSSKRHPTFSFDRVLPEQSTQSDLYNTAAKERVEEFLRGFNVTFLAYGQTSSGKSYSMGTTGDEQDYLDLSETSRAGLIPRTVETVFRRAEEIRMASGPGASWECRVSFLELYNEDLIDLLANSNAPTNVTIRENQDGRIVWSGVREVKVSNVHEVMALLCDGSTRRRTGETNMNLTSSRSHAIFSLNLVQSRRAETSNGDDVRGTPTKRPMSVIGTPSRSTTPVFQRAPPSSFSKLARPTSMHVGGFNKANGDDEMVVITSKFNMVDLAGSERLKRTAAQGERMKEGISINSGLLALGNVISALSEPGKKGGHVPYRDSKLTRLLQDSIGGNAMTTMIACISPLEFNISETINTINYASRARRIKNAVTKNQSEVGWDDMDYLRNTVLRLRAKITTIENEPRAARRISDAVPESADDDVLQRQVVDLTDKLADLEDEFSHLQDQYFQKCREIVALSDPDTLEDDKLRQFNETIEPVVLEYEKVVTSLNGQIAELRAEAAVAQQAHEDHAGELSKTHKRLGEHESYVQELQGRLSKLTQRNDSSEAYIRDLETKFRTFTDSDDRQTEVITSLTQEIQHLKNESSKSNTYIAELESRISASEARTGDLSALVERYEREAEEREKAYRELESRLGLLDDDQQSVGLLLEELETKERKIEDLETQLQTAHTTSIAAAAEIAATQEQREAVTEPQSLSTPPDTPPVLRTIAEDSESEVDILRKENETLLLRLREAEARYELLEQAPEAAPATPTLDPPSEQDEELSEDHDTELSHSPGKRESTGESSESDTTLETPKLASRTVSPQIQDDPLNQAMQRSPYSTFRPRSIGEPRLLRPLSLSQGLSNLSYPNTQPRYSWSAPSNGLQAYDRSPKFDRSPKRQSIPFDALKPARSLQSLEIDNSLLQKTVADREAQLKQREVEIKYLKRTLEQSGANSPSQLEHNEVIGRLRKDHSDELNKMFDTHNRSMAALEEEHVAALSQVHSQLTDVTKKHEVELGKLRESHKRSFDELDERHRGEVESSTEMKTALDAAWEELATTSRRHQTERDNLTAGHHKEIADVEERHANVLGALQTELAASSAQLKSVREELAAAQEARSKAEKDLAERPEPKDMIPLDEHTFVVSAMEEMEKALTAAEDEKRQLKMKADQVRFELSRISDEHEMQRSSDLSKLAELEKRCSSLASDNAELKSLTSELQRNRDSKQSLIDRSSRTKLPPIGPPPTAPLPPVPAGREAVLSPTLTNASLSRNSHHEGSVESTRSSRYDHDQPSSPQHRPNSVLETERDKAIAEREEVLQQISEEKERYLELETQLSTEKRNNEQFTKDLIELRKNNSKLKVRVDDVNRELTELKRERDALRRDVVEMKNELADAEYERIADRQRLEGARAEVAQYKAKLDRMVDAKVSKRSDQKLKCF